MAAQNQGYNLGALGVTKDVVGGVATAALLIPKLYENPQHN